MNRSIRELAEGFSAYLSEQAKSANANYRATLLHNEYRARRLHYETLVRSMGCSYDDNQVGTRTLRRLQDRGLVREPRRQGEIHTLAFLPVRGWHSQLLQPLNALGPVSLFDGQLQDQAASLLPAGAQEAVFQRREVCESFERYAVQAAAKRPVDWIFVYAPGAELLVSTLSRVREIVRAPVVGMCFDDKQSWQGPIVDGQNCGQVGFVPHLDVGWTSSREVCDWYLAEGGNPIHLPEGCDTSLFSPDDTQPEIDMCFVGQAYGFRRQFVARLRTLGLRVHTAGPGWPEGPANESEFIRIFRKSKVILGHGGIGWSEDLKNVKGRDFDAPAVGMGCYLTSFNPELLDCFHVGQEILCYSSIDECYEVARRLLRDSSLQQRIAKAGRARCLREHTWHHRFKRILRTLGILSDSNAT